MSTAAPTELHSLILHDTLVKARHGTNSTEAENQRAGHLFYAAGWTRKYDCQHCFAARLSATSLCQWGARTRRGTVPRAPGGRGLSGKLCCHLLFLIACYP